MHAQDPSRYARQERLPEIQVGGQRRIEASHAAIVGCGALGCASADLLARAGVGSLTLIDRDIVETVNLQRQTLFDQSQVGMPKAAAAGARLGAVNPSVRIVALVSDLVPRNAESLLGFDSAKRPTVLIDGTDNFETRFLLNDLAVKHRVPLIYGGGIGTEGAVAMIGGAGRACLRCVFDGVPAPGSQPTCETTGVLGPVTTAVGARQAALAIRAMVDPDPQRSELERFDLWTGDHSRMPLTRDPDCACCSGRRFEYLDSDVEPAEASMCGRDAVQIPASGPIDLESLAARLGGGFAAGPFMVRGEIDNGRYHLTVFGDGRTIVKGTRDPAEARSVHARYVGS